MTSTTTLTVAAADLQVLDEFDETLDGETTHYRVQQGPRPSVRAGQIRVGCAYVVGEDRRRISLAFPADEQIQVTRPLPPTDAEHEANLRALVAEPVDLREIHHGVAIAAVLRLLDQARAQARAGTDDAKTLPLGDLLLGPVNPDFVVRRPGRGK